MANTAYKSHPIYEYGMLTIGVLLLAIGNYFFKFPNNFTFGGVTGISVLLSAVVPSSISTITTVLNLSFLLLGFIFLGKSFGKKTIFVTLLFSFVLTLYEKLFPMTAPLTNQPILELFFAILLPSVAAAIFFSHNASSGGTDIVAMIIRKYLHVETGRAVMIADALVVSMSFFLYGTTVGLYSLIGWISKAIITEYYMTELNLNKCLTIICDNETPICDFIKNTLRKSSTVYNAVGSYSHDNKHVILTALSPAQASILCDYLKTTDPHAFVMVTKTSEIKGKGFMPL